MKAFKNLLIFLVVLIVITFVIPVDLRTGWFNYGMGRVSELTGDTASASDRYLLASESMPDSVTFARSYARALNDLGELTKRKDYYDDAYDVADDWIKDHEDEIEVWQLWIEKARAEWGLESTNAAKISIDTAIKLQPTDYTALVYQGIIYRDLRPNNKDAIRQSIPIFEQAIEVRRQTRTAWARYELAVAYKLIDDHERAINEVNQCLAQFPSRDLREKAERLLHDLQSSGRSER
jgi:tetratricopeptide (TPR) repeat protein